MIKLALNKIHFRFFLVLFFFFIQSEIFSSHPIENKVLSRLHNEARLLSTLKSQRCLAQNETDGNQLIASYQNIVYDEIAFDTESTDKMTINCYYNKTCLVDQFWKLGNIFSFSIPQANITAENLPRVWACFGILKVLLLDNLDILADAFNEIIQNISLIVIEFAKLRGSLVDRINKLIIEFEQNVTNNTAQLFSEIQVQLNDTNSDLALQFDNILTNAFIIVIGRLLEQISSDYLFFANSLLEVLTTVMADISINENSLENANQTLVLANIELVRSNFSQMAQSFIDEFNKYQQIENNYTEIMSDLIQNEIIEKFNFSDDNITILVRDFMLNIIQRKRNLFNETDDLFISQFEKYKANLNDSVANATVLINSQLDNLKASIQANSSNQTNSVDSLFTNSDEIAQLFSVNHTIDALGSLTSFADEAFQQALSDFQADFVQFVNNLEQFLQYVNVTFNASYDYITTFWENLVEKAVQDFNITNTTIWKDLYIIKKIFGTAVQKLINNSYVFNDEEQSRLDQFNLFLIGPDIYQPFEKFFELKNFVIQFLPFMQEKLSENQNKTLNFTGTNSTIITDDIKQNLTIFVNKTVADLIVGQLEFDTFLYKIETFLGIQNNNVTSVNFTDFISDLAAFGKVEGEIGLEIARGVILNKIDNLTLVNSSVIEALKVRFSQCTLDRYTFPELPIANNYTQTINLTDLENDDLDNIMSVTLGYQSVLNGSYGSYNAENISAIYFELHPNITITSLMSDRLKDLAVLDENVTVSATGSALIRNILLLAFVSITSDLIIAENIIVDKLYDFLLNITKSQSTITINTTLVCDQSNSTCENQTIYGWSDPLIFQQINPLPDVKNITKQSNNVNFTDLLN